MKNWLHTNRYPLLLGILGAVFFIPMNGNLHLFDWDEINFAEIAREMVLTRDYLRIRVNYLPFNEKPPLFMWMQALSMEAFGINEFAARFPNALCGILVLVLLYQLGKKLYDHKFGLIWSLTYFGTLLPHFYFKSAIIDPWFNLFIFLGLHYLILFHWKRNRFDKVLSLSQPAYMVLACLFTGLAILTKGPVAFLIIALTVFVYWIRERFRWFISVPQLIAFSLGSLVVTLVWYGVEYIAHGPKFLIDFTIRQYTIFSTADAGHEGFPGYHFVVPLLGCFPASIFLLRSLYRQPHEKNYQADYKRWMLILFWVVLILFTIVKSKIVHYSSMCYYPMSYLAALVVWQISQGQIAYRAWMGRMLFAIGGIWILTVVLTPIVGLHIEWLKPLLAADPFAQANLNAQVPWTGWEGLSGIFLLGIIVLSVRYFKSQEAFQGFLLLFGGTAVFLTLVLILYIGKIEGITQRASIEFLKTLRGKPCYVLTIGYKSYAQLFYAAPSPDDKPLYEDPDQWREYLLKGETDREVYILTKNTTEKDLLAWGLPDIQRLYEKNGFVFYKRPPVKK
jgi:4-amino-4-deoxy-L-arabinose transferase-like glycosyltransferase